MCWRRRCRFRPSRRHHHRLPTEEQRNAATVSLEVGYTPRLFATSLIIQRVILIEVV